MDHLKQIACDAIDKEKDKLFDLSTEIWNYKELAFQEHKSHAALTKFLEDRGFTVHRQYKLDTAFLAQFETPKPVEAEDVPSHIPHIAILCEYDALPEIGHGCGHNLIAELGVAAAIGIKAALEQTNETFGKLSVIGTPAEEAGGGKIELMKAGVFDDIDVAMMAHPSTLTVSSPFIVGGKKFMVNYHGKPSHAAGSPWNGVNALDAAVLSYVNIATLRQQIHPTWRIHAIITKGGIKTNIIPDETEMMVQVRAQKSSEIQQAETKVRACLRAGAEATGCTVDIADFPNPYISLLTNKTLARLFETNGALIGLEFTQNIDNQVMGSTDMGNLSLEIPCIHPMYDCGAKDFNHTRGFAEAAGSQEAQPPTIVQGKTLAMVALDVYSKPGLLDTIKQEFENDRKDF